MQPTTQQTTGTALHRFDARHPRYQCAIRVKGTLDARCAAELPNMTFFRIGDETILQGPVADASALERVFHCLGRYGADLVGTECLIPRKEADPGSYAVAASRLASCR